MGWSMKSLSSEKSTISSSRASISARERPSRAPLKCRALWRWLTAIRPKSSRVAPVESIFNLAISDKVPAGEFRVNPDEEKITILAERETYYKIFNIRNNALGKAVLLNSVYLPALMEVLSVLEQDAAAYRDRSWFRVFEAKCTHFNINMEKPELLEASQKLLRTPFPRVCTLLGEMD